MLGQEVNLSDLWYTEFLKCHPDYKSSKKNLWRKYKWYKLRMSEVKKEENGEIDEVKDEIPSIVTIKDECKQTAEPAMPLLKMKNVRKDVFHNLKAVLEEARIFLPMKLPENEIAAQQSQPSNMMPATQTLVTYLAHVQIT